MDEVRFTMCQRLDSPMRVVGLSMDELVLCVPLFLFLLFSGHTFIGFILATSIWFGLRKLKGNQGDRWIVNLIYWFLPFDIFKRTPKSQFRHWIG